MYMLSRVSGPIGPVFCVVVIFFGHFYVLNLFLAVIWHTYQNHAKFGDTPLSTQRSTQRDANNARDDNCEEPTRPLLFGYARSSPDLPPPPRLHRSLRCEGSAVLPALRQLVQSNGFALANNFVVFANVGLMMCAASPSSLTLQQQRGSERSV